LLKLAELRKERLRDFNNQLEFYQKNPLDYFHEKLGIRKETIDWSLIPEYDGHVWDGTPNPFMKILECLVANKWVGVESGTGTGKTFNAALIVLWFLECFPNSLVVTTAPKEKQLLLHVWKEIGKLHDTFGRGDLRKLALRMNPGRDDWVAVGFVAGVKANEESATKAQGFHAEHMLIIIEETPGVPHPIITAFQSTCTSPHNLILALGNPDHQLDNLHKFCNMENVEHIRISSYDHPNVVTDNPLFIPGAASRSGLERILNRFGRGNPMAESRTRGISPSSAIDSLIKIEWIKSAIDKLTEYLDENDEVRVDSIPGKKGLGADVANSEFGDKAALARGKGEFMYNIVDFQCPDANQLGHQIYLISKEENIPPENIGIDGVGVGAGTVNTLKEYGYTQRNINIQSSATPVSADGVEQFNNLRSQMWWQMREDLRLSTIGIIDDEDLVADLLAPKFRTERGKIVVESKEEIKKRLGRSPNKGDAVVYWNWVRSQANPGIETIITLGTPESTKILRGYN